MGQTLAIVTSQWPIVPTGIYGRMMLRSARVKGIAITGEAMNCFARDFIILHIVVELFIAHYGTLRDQTIYTRFGLENDKSISYLSWLNIFVYFSLHFRTPVFQHGVSLVKYNIWWFDLARKGLVETF